MNKPTITTKVTTEPSAEDAAVFRDAMRKFHWETQTRNASLNNAHVFRFALDRPSQMDTDHLPASTFTPGRACCKRCYADLKEGCDDDNAERSQRHRRVKKIRRPSKNNISDDPIPAIPGWLESGVRRLGGSQIKFVMKKKLSQCDLSANNNRLSIPERQIREEFLTDEEKLILSTRETEGRRRDKPGRPKSIDVQVVDPCMREHTVCLKRWEMVSSITFNLTGKWKEVVQSSNLQENQIFNIWCYRNSHSTLTFVLASSTHDLGNPSTNQQ